MQTQGGYFILEGIECCGKSTQVRFLQQKLQAMGHEVMIAREPGSSLIGEQVRSILLNPGFKDQMRPLTELLLFNAARHQFLEETVRPALHANVIVLSDRSFLSSLAYQGHGHGIDLDVAERVCMAAINDIIFNRIYILDITLEEMQSRNLQRDKPADRYEIMGTDFFSRVRNGYLAEAKKRPGLVEVVDAHVSEDALTQELLGRIISSLQMSRA